MKKDRLHKVISLLTLVFLVLPIGLQLNHALENHHHRICNSKILKHIHTQELDCSIYHVQLRTESPDLNTSTKLFIEIVQNSTPLFLAKKRFYKPLKNINTRGSPLFII